MIEKIPNTWVATSVAEICHRIHYGFTDSANHEGSGVKFLRISDIQDGKVDWASVPFCSISLANATPYLLKKGDLLFARTGGTVGKSYLVASDPPDTVFASYLIRLIPSEKMDPAYAAIYFQSSNYWAQIELNKTGLKTNVNASILGSLTIPLPPHNEQKRIVAKIEELFSELDFGEESLRRARRQLGVYRQSLLKQAFEGKLTATWRTQNPDLLESPDQLLSRIQSEREARYEERLQEWEKTIQEWELAGGDGKKPSKPKRPTPSKQLDLGEDDQLYALPNGWSWFAFKAACYESVLGKMLDKSKNRGDLKPYLRNINVRWGAFDLANLLDIRIEATEVERYRADLGDLIICEGGEPGRCAVWSRNAKEEVFLQKALHRVRFTHGVSPQFIQHLMSLWANTKRLETHFTGTTIKHLTGAGLSGVPVPLCSLPEQQEIVRQLDEQFTVIEQNEREIDAALKRSEALRQSILKKAFSGQLVPQDPADEPAATLLSRIRTTREAQAAATKKKPKAKKKTKKAVRKTRKTNG